MKFASVSAVLVLAGALSTVHADPLSLSDASAAQAAAQIGNQYGVNIVYKTQPGALPPVTLTADDADAPGARLQAVSDLANAVAADFTKTFVVSRLADSDPVPDVKIDNSGVVVFASITVPAADAIRMVAGVDNATAQVGDDISGTVTFTATTLSAPEAAKQIAAQTHTRWKTFYALTPRTQGRTTGDKVIGHTASGSPITVSPYVYFKHLPTAAEVDAQNRADAAAAAAAQKQAQAEQAAASAYNSNYPAQNNQNPYNNYNPYGANSYGMGNNPYGASYSPYGFDPYGANGYGGGYNPYGGFVAGTGVDVSNSFAPIVIGGY